MSQTVLGLDIGHRRVKAVQLETTYKSFRAVAFAEVPLLPEDGELSFEERVGQAVTILLETHDLASDITVTALPGDQVTTRVIELPFTREREIDLVIGPELEELLPFSDLDEVVFDYQVLERTDAGSRLLVAVADRAFLARLLAALKLAGVDPRVVTVTGFTKAELVRNMAIIEDGPLVVCDLGYEVTTVTVVRDGKTAMWRAFKRGGRRVEEALAKVDANDSQAVSNAIGGALTPLIRDLKHILLAAGGLLGDDVRGVYLTGGTSRLTGLDRYLAQKLGVDVVHLEPSRAAFNDLPEGDRIDSSVAEALSLALRAMPGQVDEVNFRKGDFAFQGAYEYLGGRVMAGAISLLFLLLSLGILAYSQFYALRAEEVTLLGELQAKSQAILGQSYTDFEAAAMDVTRAGPEGKNPIPRHDGYHLLYDFSVKVGNEPIVDVDLFEVDLIRHRAELRGRTDSATSVQTIAERLAKVKCVEKVETERNERGTDERQLFYLAARLDEDC